MENLSFEEALERLQATITALQDGKLPLGQALQQYQEGVKLARYCEELLQNAELTLQELRVDDEDGDIYTLPLDIS